MDKNRFENRPNLLRVAAELSKCKDPDRVLEALRSILKRSVDDPANSEQIITCPQKTAGMFL